MEMVLFILLIITSVCSVSAKHVFISTGGQPWWSAQEYCRKYYTDLSPITSELDDEVFRRSVGESNVGWIGLYRDSSSPTGWTWSGGEHATHLNWVNTPSSSYNYTYRTISGWYATSGYSYYNFFCLNLIVVDEKKSWEEALDHCRETHTDLVSLLSETEHLLARKALEKVHITERVWIGLRYLVDRWLWMNGDPLVYEAWPHGADQDHQCPIQNRCGALTEDGLWENRDCAEKLYFICM